MKDIMANGVPLTASVLDNNQSAMADRLITIGFTKAGTKGMETKFRWDPANAN
jgi:hypothetical protein